MKKEGYVEELFNRAEDEDFEEENSENSEKKNNKEGEDAEGNPKKKSKFNFNFNLNLNGEDKVLPDEYHELVIENGFYIYALLNLYIENKKNE